MSDARPLTVAVVNSKGGVTKTTTAICLAEIFGGLVGPTLLLDLDRQASAVTLMAAANDEGRAMQAKAGQVPADTPPARLARLIDGMGQGHDYLVIDTPPGDMDRIDAAIEAVVVNGGIVVIPTGTTELDLPRALVTLEDVGERAKAVILLTKTRPNTTALRQARRDLEALGAAVLAAEVPLRETLANLTTRGLDEALAVYSAVAEELLGVLVGEGSGAA
jgi:chromosome partitioning protein